MFIPHPTKRFNQDLTKMQKRGKDIRKFWDILPMLAAGQPLPANLRDHALTGDFAGCRDLHIEPDWILIYQVSGEELRLLRTGTHSDLM